MRRVWLVLICLVFLETFVQAKGETNNVYLLTSSETSYDVILYNWQADDSELLYSVPRMQQSSLEPFFPQAELDALAAYPPVYERNFGRKLILPEQFEIVARLKSITVSKDNQNVIAEIFFQTCFGIQKKSCFGTTQLVLINSQDKRERVVFNLGSHSEEYVESDFGSIDTIVTSVEWLPDQSGIVVGIQNGAYRTSLPRSTFVVLPLDGSAPLEIGVAIMAWAAPNSPQFTMLTQNNNNDSGAHPNTLTTIDLDLEKRQFSRTSNEIGTWDISGLSGLAYLDTSLIFQVANDFTRSEVSNGGLATFDLQTQTATMILPNQFFLRLENTSDGRAVIAETQDNHLVKMVMGEKGIKVTPLVDMAVKRWALSGDDQLLVQYVADDTFAILDIQGKPMGSRNALQGLELPAGVELLAFDW